MPAYKGTKGLGTLRGGVHPKGTAPVMSMTATQGPRTTDRKMVNKPTMGNDSTNGGADNNTYVSATVSATARSNFYRKARTPGLGN